MRTNELRHKLAKPKTTYLHTIKQNDTTAQHTRKNTTVTTTKTTKHAHKNNTIENTRIYDIPPNQPTNTYMDERTHLQTK